MPSTDARICSEFREALDIWGLVKGFDQENNSLWSEEVVLLRRELMREREIWMENQLPMIHR